MFKNIRKKLLIEKSINFVQFIFSNYQNFKYNAHRVKDEKKEEQSHPSVQAIYTLAMNQHRFYFYCQLRYRIIENILLYMWNQRPKDRLEARKWLMGQ